MYIISAASIDDGCDGTGLCIDTGDGEFMEISLHSRNSFERKKNPSQDSGFEDRGSKSKRKGLSEFLTRYKIYIMCIYVPVDWPMLHKHDQLLQPLSYC
jgi:hypothetical protein